MSTKPDSAISRREFARRAALVSAAASVSPASLLGRDAPPSAPLPQQPENLRKLPPESQAEADSRLQAILTQYSARFSAAQKTDLRRLAAEVQLPLDRLRAFATENGDGSALYLRPLIEREKRPAPSPATSKPAGRPKKS